MTRSLEKLFQLKLCSRQINSVFDGKTCYAHLNSFSTFVLRLGAVWISEVHTILVEISELVSQRFRYSNKSIRNNDS